MTNGLRAAPGDHVARPRLIRPSRKGIGARSLPVVNRVCDPRSKRSVRRFVTEVIVGAFFSRRMIEVFGLDTQALILDMTNFATFIDLNKTMITGNSG